MRFLKHFVFFILLISIITLADYFYLEKPSIGIDDANIFLNYARHFSRGEGFVYNTNGEHVEGFTSMLWVLICAAFYCISNHPETLIIIFLLLITSLTVTLAYEEVKSDVELIDPVFCKNYFLGLFSIAIACVAPSFIAWSVLSLMENGIWNFIFISSTILVLRSLRIRDFSFSKKIILLVLAILLIVTRPEGLAWIIIFTIVLSTAYLKNGKTILFPFLFFTTACCAAAALIYFRLHYFGYPLPNTYYAKVSGDKQYNIQEGFKYALSFITGYHPLITLFIAILIVSAFRNFNLKFFKKTAQLSSQEIVLNRIVIVIIIIAGGIFLPLVTGGDHFGGFRFYQDILLLLVWAIPAVLLLLKNIFIHKQKEETKSLLMITFLFFFFIGINAMFNLKNPAKTQLNYEFDLAKQGRNTGNELNEFWIEDKPSAGVIAAGGFALMYQGKTIDLMGLNDTLMGHSSGSRVGIKNHAAFNKNIFYKLNADIILPKDVEDAKGAEIQYAEFRDTYDFDNLAMKNIFNDSEFSRQYKCVAINKKSLQKIIFAFASNSFLNKMKADSSLSVTVINASEIH
jgi:arabinofuranosyltransferase